MTMIDEPLHMELMDRPGHDYYVINSIIDRWHYEHETFEPKPKKFKLVDHIDDVKIVAAEMVKKWGNLFEVNELINEAWICLQDEEFTTLGRLRTAVHCDIVDYIRSVVGREGKGRLYSNGAIIKDKVKMAAKSLTNTIDRDLEEGERNRYERQAIDPRFKQIEDQEFIDSIFKQVEMTKKEKNIFLKRFKHSMGPNQIAKEIGLKVGTQNIHYYLRKNLRRFHAIKNRLDVEWVLKHKERLMLS